MPARSRRRTPLRVTAVGLATAVVTALLSAGPVLAAETNPHHGRTVPVRLMSFNDLHGNLQPPGGSSGRVTVAPGTTVDAGGAAYLATHVEQLRAQVPNSLLFSSGDNIGASPLASAVFHDEPTIEVLNAMGVRASVVGNHEFDEGYAELQRIQNGGCHAQDGCQFDAQYDGADFPFLGANVTFRDSGQPALMPFTVQRFGGVRVGIIGVTLKDLPDVVLPSAVENLQFGDEVQAIDRTSRMLTKLGVRAQVVLMHQGDETSASTAGPNTCDVTETDPARTIAERADAAVDVVFAAHTHQDYVCTVTDPAGQPRTLIQGLSFGRLVSTVDVQISTRSRDIVRRATTAQNVIVTRDVTPDAEVQAIVDRAVTQSAPIANRRVGTITADLVRGTLPEQPLGDVIADAQLAATQASGAVIAMTNPGGIRTDLTYASSPAGEGDGVVTYGEAFAVQPFANIMQTITLTGAQLDAVLEQQAQANGVLRFLQVSDGFSYTWSTGAPAGSKASNLQLDGTAIDPAAAYRVSVNNFLAAGGDGFTVLAEGTDLVGGPIDLDAFTAYLTANSPVSPPPSDRIIVVS